MRSLICPRYAVILLFAAVSYSEAAIIVTELTYSLTANADSKPTDASSGTLLIPTSFIDNVSNSFTDRRADHGSSAAIDFDSNHVLPGGDAGFELKIDASAYSVYAFPFNNYGRSDATIEFTVSGLSALLSIDSLATGFGFLMTMPTVLTRNGNPYPMSGTDDEYLVNLNATLLPGNYVLDLRQVVAGEYTGSVNMVVQVTQAAVPETGSLGLVGAAALVGGWSVFRRGRRF